MARKEFRYDAINRCTKEQEPFSAPFDTPKKAKNWFKKYGEIWEKRGVELLYVEKETLTLQK